MISAILAGRLTSFVWMRNALLSLLLRKTTARKSLPLCSLLNDQTLTSFNWLALVVDDHAFELVKLESFHKHFLLLLELKLLL